jgi:hypothetical protein
VADKSYRVTFPSQFMVMRVEQSTPREEVKRLMKRQVADVIERTLEEIPDKPAEPKENAAL